MADKRKLIIKQRIKTVSFIAETKKAAENIWMFPCSFSKYYSPAYLTIWKGWLNYGVKMSPWCNVCTTHNVDAVSFMPQPATGLPINTQWYMPHGATQHITNIKLDLFPDTCGPSVISGQHTDHYAYGRIWPPNSDFFLWRFMFPKEKSHQCCLEPWCPAVSNDYGGRATTWSWAYILIFWKLYSRIVTVLLGIYFYDLVLVYVCIFVPLSYDYSTCAKFKLEIIFCSTLYHWTRISFFYWKDMCLAV